MAVARLRAKIVCTSTIVRIPLDKAIALRAHRLRTYVLTANKLLGGPNHSRSLVPGPVMGSQPQAEDAFSSAELGPVPESRPTDLVSAPNGPEGSRERLDEHDNQVHASDKRQVISHSAASAVLVAEAKHDRVQRARSGSARVRAASHGVLATRLGSPEGQVSQSAVKRGQDQPEEIVKRIKPIPIKDAGASTVCELGPED